jgi:hypothetical protein
MELTQHKLFRRGFKRVFRAVSPHEHGQNGDLKKHERRIKRLLAELKWTEGNEGKESEENHDSDQ